MSSSGMASAAPDGEVRVSRVLFTMRWRLMSQILLALPVVGMFICLITSIIFHSDHINNTICKVSTRRPALYTGAPYPPRVTPGVLRLRGAPPSGSKVFGGTKYPNSLLAHTLPYYEAQSSLPRSHVIFMAARNKA